MTAIQCKICGGLIELPSGRTLGECPFCGSQVTLPVVTDETHAAAFNRGNHFRRIGEFDKALAVYERIVQEDEGNAEAHWCSALCRFGIEYVKDPATGEYLPTCHRASYDSFLEDVDYLAALAHADDAARAHYQRDAEQIAQVQRGILAVSQSEKPFDVFLCYKETDANGQRTRDSQLAQDVYYQLTDQGLRVFFARITLEDKPGTQFEPYIFAALNTAKVMVVVGTKPEHLSATWVRNEWSRYLAIMKRDRTRLLIPCYRDMDPYDMPEQLSILQGYDMSRIGFIQDLVRGIRKVVGEEKPAVPAPQAAPATTAAPAAPATEPLLRRVALFLEDGDWQSADEYCERVLDIDPENARAYLGKLMAALRVTQQEKLRDVAQPFDGDPNYRKALRFADAALKKELQDANAHIRERNENAVKEAAYRKAEQALAAARTEQDFANARKQYEELGSWRNAAARAQECETKRKDWLYRQAENALAAAKAEQDFIAAKKLFVALNGWKDAAKQAELCAEKAEEARKNAIYDKASLSMTLYPTEAKLTEAIRQFQSIPGWRDADQRVEACRQMIEKPKAEAAARAEAAKKAAQQRKRRIGIGTAVLAAVVAVVLFVTQVIIPTNQYNTAAALAEDGNTALAAIRFGKLGSYKDAAARSHALWVQVAERHTIAAGDYHTVGLRADGTVVAIGDNTHDQCDVSGWRDVVSIAAGNDHTVGLRADGTVVAVRWNYYGQCDVSGWRDVVAIAAGYKHTVGLRADGTVVAVGDNDYKQCDVSGWRDVVAIAAGSYHTVGLRADGTVIAVGYNYYKQCDVSGWRDMVAIAAGDYHTVGLRADGTVVAVGDNVFGQCDVSGWRDVVAISAGYLHTVGLRADGTVVAVGENDDGQCYISGWRDVVAISAGYKHTVGLRADGTVVAVGINDDGQCNVSDWQLKQIPRPTLPQ